LANSFSGIHKSKFICSAYLSGTVTFPTLTTSPATSWGSSPSEIARWKNNLNHTNHNYYVKFNNLLFQKKMLGSVLAALVGKTT
jgi:hypothetical protein